MQPGIDDARIVEYQGTLRAYIFCDMPVCRFTDLVILIDQQFRCITLRKRMQGNTVIREFVGIIEDGNIFGSGIKIKGCNLSKSKNQ